MLVSGEAFLRRCAGANERPLERKAYKCAPRPLSQSFKAANRVLVDFHQSLPLSQVWGDGGTSSSDGQRFGVQGSSLIGSFYPRYFGYYDRALTIYTHISDQYSVFGSRVISCGPREALHVLDGLIQNDTTLSAKEHFTDTRWNLRSETFKAANRVLVDFHQSLPLSANPRADGVAKALTVLGRIVKTTYLLRYMRDEELRQRICTQLNRGEHRHALARRIFFGSQGVFRTGDYEEMMNKASALSLLSNAVLVWNTMRISSIVAKLDARDADLARVSPLAHAHLIPSGTYHVISGGTYHFGSEPSPPQNLLP